MQGKMTTSKYPDSELGLCSRFRVGRFCVPISLIGKSHTFVADGRRVDIMLPWKYWDKEKPAENPEFEMVAVACGWKPRSKQRKSSRVAHRVGVDEIIIHVHSTKIDGLRLPKDIDQIGNFNDHRAAFEAVNKKDILDARFDELFSVSLKQFDRWCRLLRLKTGKHSFEQFEFGNTRNKQSSYFATSHDLKRLRGSTDAMIIYALDDISAKQWNAIGRAFEKGEAPEVWYDLLFEAMHKAQYGEHRGAVISLAIATEAFLRRKLATSIKRLKVSDPALYKQITTSPISRLLDRRKGISAFKKLNIDEPFIGQLRQLLTDRNDIMHSGKMSVEQQAVRTYIAAVEKLIA